MLIGNLYFEQGIIELVQLLAGCMLPASFHNASFKYCDKHLELFREGKLPALIKDAICVIKLAKVTIVDINTLVSHPLKHQILLILELAKYHREKRE